MARRSEPLTVSTVLAPARNFNGRRSGNTFPLVGFEPLLFWDSKADDSEELARRLIILIFAGRNRMDMIRRELPRTKRADWGRSRYRIERWEDSPFRGPCTVIGSAVPDRLSSLYAALVKRCCLSVCTAIAQMKPSNSRPSAVTIWFLFLPPAANT
jgi:hypothetical protein